MPVGLGDEVMWLCPSLDDSPNDLSGNGNNGTYVNGTATVADSDPTYGGSRAYNFDGTDDYIDCGFPITNTSFSVSGWYNTDSVNGSLLGSYDWTLNRRSFYLRLYYSKVQFRVALAANNAGTVIESTASVSTGTWYHVAATWDATSGDMEVFINGSTEATGTMSVMAPLLDPLTLGSYGSSGTDYDGKQDDIRVFQRVLTQSEITLLASTRGFTVGGGTHINRTLLGVG